MSCTLPRSLLRLTVGDNPDIGEDASVVEELVGERDDRLQPIVLYDPAADFTFAAAASPVKRGEPLNTMPIGCRHP